MYTRLLNPPKNHSYFLFGPRGTGKTTFLQSEYPHAHYIDLLRADVYTTYLANPEKLEKSIPPNFTDFIIIDEIQRVPELLNEVHRLIESPAHYKFILTGSSARKLRHQGVNLLAGRAYLYYMHPLTINELGADFNLAKSLQLGTLPACLTADNPQGYLDSYLGSYLEQEINQEGLTRNLSAFYRFLQVASFSQGSPLNTSSIAREVSVQVKVVDNYFSILIDLLIGVLLPSWTRRAKRRLVHRPKFYFVDAGLYNTARPSGYLDKQSEIGGIALETLFFSHLRAVNDYYQLRYTFSYYQTASGQEIDFVAYGKNGFFAFEIKLGAGFSPSWTRALTSFGKDYPEAKLYLIYTGSTTLYHNNITILPVETALKNLTDILTSSSTTGGKTARSTDQS